MPGRGFVEQPARFVARHILDVGSAPLLDDVGFLRLLEENQYRWFGRSKPIDLGELVGAQSFVLLAPGAAGKSTALSFLTSMEPDALTVDLRLSSVAEARSLLSDSDS